MNKIQIRKCRKEDFTSIILLQKEWENEEITYGFTACDKEYLKSKLGEYFFVAENNDQIIGFVYGTLHKAKNISIFQDGEYYIEIDDLYVLSKYRGKGIGHQLLNNLLTKAKNNGIERSLLYSATKDMDSIVNFYKKHDYKPWNIQMYK